MANAVSIGIEPDIVTLAAACLSTAERREATIGWNGKAGPDERRAPVDQTGGAS
jgi:hypothetical protein